MTQASEQSHKYLRKRRNDINDAWSRRHGLAHHISHFLFLSLLRKLAPDDEMHYVFVDAIVEQLLDRKTSILNQAFTAIAEIPSLSIDYGRSIKGFAVLLT